MNRRIFRTLLFGICALLLQLGALSQVTTSSIRGKVTDTKEMTLPGVLISAKHEPSGTVYRGITDASGTFNINGMRTGGPYTVEASFIGFEKAVIRGLRLELGEATNVDIVMHDTHVSLDEVVITADANTFNTTRTGAAVNFGKLEIETMPTVSRSIFDVTKLTPQAISRGNGTSFAGASNRYNSFQIDGTVNNDVFGLSSAGTNGDQSGVSPISLDAIQELQVVIAPFDVRQSGFTGAGINAVTKSGTNTFSGSAYTYYRDENFVGVTPGKNVEKRTKLNQQKTGTYGFTFGGPIVKDKLFFFTNAEYSNDTYPVSYNVGDGSNITREEAQQVADKIKQLTGGKYDGGGFEPIDITTKGLNLLGRVDWNINQDHNLSVRYSYVKGRRLNFSRASNNLRFSDNGYYMNNRTNSIVAELNSRFNNGWSNELRLGYTRVRDFREPVGMPFPNITIRGYKDGKKDRGTISLGTEKYSAANELDQDIFTVSDNVTYSVEDHTWTFGTHNEFFKMRNLFIRDNFGAYIYNTPEDFMTVGTANEVLPSQYDYSFSDVNGNRRWSPTFNAAQIGFYAQDEWNVNDRFRATMGLRVDVPIFTSKPTENKVFNNTEVAKENNLATNQMPKSQLLFSPRFGFRYNLTEDKSALLRGGVGVFTGRVPFVWISNAYSNSGVEYNRTQLRDRKDFEKAVNDGFKFESDPNKQYVPSKVFSSEIDVLDKNFKFPQVLRFNLAWEQRLPYDVKFTLEGLYSKTLNNVLFKNLQYMKKGTLNATYGDNRFLYQKNPQAGPFNGIIYMGNTNKGYTYNISAKLEKDFKFGLNTMVAYTYAQSKAVNDGTSSQAYSNWQYNEVYNGDDDQIVSYSDFNVPHRLIASVSYHKKYAKYFGTTASLFYNGQSGNNYTFVYNYSDINGDGAKGNDLLWVPTSEQVQKMNFKGGVEDAKAYDKWISEQVGLDKYRGTFAPRNAFNAPFEHHFDLYLAQDFYINVAGRTNTLQVNFNILNVGNLLNPEWGIERYVGYNYAPVSVDRNGTMELRLPKEGLHDVSDFNSRWRAQVGVKWIF